MNCGWPKTTSKVNQRIVKKMDFFEQGFSPPESKQKVHHVLVENQPAIRQQLKDYKATKDLSFAEGSEFTAIASSLIDDNLEIEETKD